MTTHKIVVGNCATTRYLTKRFAAISFDEAQRLAAIDRMPLEKVQQTSNVQLLHVHHSELWAWWNDGILTTGLGLKPGYSPNLLSADAEELIHTVCLSICTQPACGWSTLAEVKHIFKHEKLAVGPKIGNYRPETLTRLIVENVNNKQGTLYTFFSAEGIEDRFEFQVTIELPIERLKASTITEIIVPLENIQKQENFYYFQLENVA